MSFVRLPRFDDPRGTPTPNADRNATKTEAARQRLHDYVATAGGGGGASSGPPAEAVDDLKANPNAAADFDKKYGAGAAARILGK